MKKNVGIILLVALFGSLLLNVCQFLDVGKVEKSDPWVGTYICGDEQDGATYLVLTAEKEFYRYQQFKMLEKDAYSVDEDGQVGCGMSGMGRRRRMRRCLTRLCLSM